MEWRHGRRGGNSLGSGTKLDPWKVVEARTEELDEYYTHEVYAKVPIKGNDGTIQGNHQ